MSKAKRAGRQANGALFDPKRYVSDLPFLKLDPALATRVIDMTPQKMRDLATVYLRWGRQLSAAAKTMKEAVEIIAERDDKELRAN